MRRAARQDGNHQAIVKELRQRGFSVADTSGVGSGFPDIIVGYGGRNFMFEIKDPAQPPSKRKLTADEWDWHRSWRGHVLVIETVSEILTEVRVK